MGQNVVNMPFICKKNFRANAWDNAAWTATRIVNHVYCLYRVKSLSTRRHYEPDQHVLIRQSDSGAPVSRSCIKAKGGYFEHKLSQ